MEQPFKKSVLLDEHLSAEIRQACNDGLGALFEVFVPGVSSEGYNDASLREEYAALRASCQSINIANMATPTPSGIALLKMVLAKHYQNPVLRVMMDIVAHLDGPEKRKS